MTETRRSVPLLAGMSVLAIGLAASPIAIDIHSMSVGDRAALAQGGGGGAGGGGAGHRRPGAGPGLGDQGARQGMGMQQAPMSQGPRSQAPMSQSGMTERTQTQMMSRETIRSVQRRLNQLGYRAGPEDGIMGPQTHRAISAYQAGMGMEANGMLTPDLVDRMGAGPKGQ